jgi:hypothetical protein
MKKDKIVVMGVMVISMLILGTIAILGKILGRGITREQEYIKEHFYYQPAQNYSEAQLALNTLSHQELDRLSQQGITLAIVVIANFISIVGALVIISKVLQTKIFAE